MGRQFGSGFISLLILVLLSSTCSVFFTTTQIVHADEASETDELSEAQDEDGHEHNVEKDHEAILGSHEAAEEFDHLDPEEAQERLRKLVGKMDLNDDGQIEKDELIAWIVESFKTLDEEQSKNKFPDVDGDKNDRISWDEYVEHYFGHEDHEDDTVKHLMEENRAYFTAADRTGDDQLTMSEWLAFQLPERHEHMKDSLVAVILRERDANHDKTLTFDEYAQNIDKKDDEEWYKQEKEHFESDYDVNKDGVLDEGEIRAWLAPDPKIVATEEAEHLTKETDANGDGLLSTDEIVDKYELWVGSDATHSGQQLLHEEL